MNTMDKEAMKCIYEGKDIIFTFKSEALEFITRNKLSYKFIEEDMVDEKHLQIKGYNSKIYWIAY